jgi:hypothetical protein
MRQKSLTSSFSESRLTARKGQAHWSIVEWKGKGCGKMWKLRSCPKCHGDVFLEKDISGWYERCLQCGYNRDMIPMVEVKKSLSSKKKEPVLQR